MKCPICGTALPLQSDRCPDCGYRCRTTAAREPQASADPAGANIPYTPPNKTKKSRCCCCGMLLFVPLVIILAALIYSAANIIEANLSVDFFGEEFFDEDLFDEDLFDEDLFADFPFEEMTPESMPAAADEGCFAVVDHTLMFIGDNWDGSAVLRIPESIGGQEIHSIGVGCFAGCEELTTILLPDTVTIISPMAFSGCTGLRGLFLPDGVEIIGTDAFADCRNLEAIHIPASVATIAPGSFDDCASLRYIFYGGAWEDWNTLYSDYINPFTTAICLDGNYYHGAGE